MFKTQLLALFLTFYVQNSSSSVLKTSTLDGQLTPELIKHFREDFDSNERNKLSQSLCLRYNPLQISRSQQVVQKTSFFFKYELKEAMPITNQKSSGRCWIFAGLNVMRLPFMNHYNLSVFEFSQSYLFFWHLIESSNTFLHHIVQATRNNEKIEDLLMSHFLSEPITDGGLWNWFVHLINRYGVIPKSEFPESKSSMASDAMHSLLHSKLREYAAVLRELVESGASNDAIQKKIDEQMNVVFRIVGICLGVPPETITWEYKDNTKKYHRISSITGLDFYKKHVKPYYNVDDKVLLCNDPRVSHPFGKLYEDPNSEYFVGGNNTMYFNQPIEILMNVTAESIMHNEGVWFTCDVNTRYAMESAIFDLRLYDIKSIFGTDIQLSLSKGDRVHYKDSSMTHAMVFTGVNFDAEEKVEKFKVENSWGAQDNGRKYHVMTADWFNEFVFQVVVDRKFVPLDVLRLMDNQKPIKLGVLDTFG